MTNDELRAYKLRPDFDWTATQSVTNVPFDMPKIAICPYCGTGLGIEEGESPPRPRLGKQARAIDVCRKCGKEFNPPPYQDDTDHTCRPCRNIMRRANWEKRKLAGLPNFSGPHKPAKMKERMSEYNRTPERKEVARQRASEIRNQPGFGKIQAARTLFRCALEKGEIKRGACSVCGVTEKVCAHHQDYDKPLDVTWLCYSCHNRIHHGRTAVRAALEVDE